MDYRILLENITPALKNIARKHLLCGFHDADDLYQEMCLYLWQTYRDGLPIGINQAYVIKGCEFHILNYLRKGRKRFMPISLDERVSPEGGTLGDLIEDPRGSFLPDLDNRVTIDNIKDKGLTDNEKKVLSFLVKGYTVREIAKNLNISHVMVLKHKKNIISKSGIRGYQE